MSASPATEPDDGVPGAGPAPPTLGSPAREFRRRRDGRRGPLRVTLSSLLLLALIGAGVYYGQNLPPPGAPTPTSVGANGGGTNATPGSGDDANFITFGTATLHPTTCGDGQTFTTEWIPWVGAKSSLSTSQFYLELVELLDGDVDGGPTPTPSVTTGYLCAGSAPSSDPSWYVVLQGPGGSNLAYYGYSQGWVPLLHGVSSVPVTDGSNLILLSVPNVAGTSFGLCALGDENGPSINVCASL